ncbi:MAG: DUF6094 domain-containing protein [Kiritimatiellae bacterium]|nr:DUF6094 domain-containing protein [Kiritimatiellia bacterium]
MRLEAQKKVGYYPTQPEVLEELKRILSPVSGSGTFTILDPCCGDGVALAALASHIRNYRGGLRWVKTFGIEISYSRAEEARQRLDVVLNAPAQECEFTPQAFSLLFLNPPYDTDDSGKRLELVFLEKFAPALIKRGVLILIIQEKTLAEVEDFLIENYARITIWRYPQDIYKEFKQIVILAVRDTPENDQPPLFIRNFPIRERYYIPEGKDDNAVIYQKPSPPSFNLSTYVGRLQSTPPTVQPIVPLKKGHLALIVASGIVGTIDLGDALIKGRTIKRVIAEEEEGEEENTRREKVINVPEVTLLDMKTGEVQFIETDHDLAVLFEKHGAAIATQAARKFPPLFDGKIPADVEKILSGLGKWRKPLPGQKEPGLLTSQKIAATGLAKGLITRKRLVFQADMGWGKTTVALAVAELLQAYPVLVLCPPHLTEKWKREAKEVLGPDVIVEEIRSIGKQNDLEVFLSRSKGKKAIAVVASTSAKMGGGWKPAVAYRNKYKKDSHVWCQKCNALNTVVAGKYTCWRCGHEALHRGEANNTSIPVCPHCGQNAPEGWEKKPTLCPACHRPLFVVAERREAIADYIKKRHRGTFKLLIADELHEYKGKSTDRGVAFYRLVKSTKYVLGLTGTFFGGKASTIFHLLARMDERLYGKYGFQEQEWVETYGNIERVTREKKERFGYYTRITRRSLTVVEKPGVSPKILPEIIDRTLFVSMDDLGEKLPPYSEATVEITPDPVWHQEYSRMLDRLKDMARSDRSWLSSFLQWGLSRPNSVFREERVTRGYGEDGPVIMTLPAYPDISPKEQYLLDLVRGEVSAGRKVLVYVRQTGVRDIRCRLASVLSGFRVETLSEEIAPRKREEWIKRVAAGLDVLITNPELVKTGLDLIQFSTVVFYEPVYSLYTLWQAMRRVWRLGQKNEVKVVFPIYKNTMEETALNLIKAKASSAGFLYGEDLAIESMDEDIAGNILRQLAKVYLDGIEVPTLESVFANGKIVSASRVSPAPTPTTAKPEPVRLSWQEWAAARGIAIKRESRQKPSATFSLPLFEQQ